MLVWELLGGLVVLLGVAAVLTRKPAVLDDEPDDSPSIGLPEGRLLRAEDIGRIRLRVGVRGYRMTEVDAVLEAARLALTETERSEPAAAAEPVAPAAPVAPAFPAAPAAPPDVVMADQPPAGVEDQPLSRLEQLRRATEPPPRSDP